jgi:hypothetical protein
MNLEGIAPGTRLVTVSGDIVELLEVSGDGETARVRYVEVESASAATANSEADMSVDDLITVEGVRFVGPPRTSSTSR